MLNTYNNLNSTISCVLHIITIFKVQNISLTFALSTAAVAGAWLHMKPASAGNLESIFPSLVQLNLVRRRVSKYQPPAWKQALQILKIFHQENTAEKYQFSNYNGNIYVHLCVPPFHFNVSWSSEMQLGVIYLETWGSTQPYVAFSTLEFCSCFFVFGATHTAANSFTLHNQCLTLWLWFKRLPCLACRMLLLWQQTDLTVELKINISMNLKLKKVTKKSL